MSYGSDEDRKAGRIAAGIVLAIAVAGGGWWYWQHSKPDEPVLVEPEVAEADAGLVEPENPPPIEHPLPPTTEPLAQDAPSVDPDQAAAAALDEVFGAAVAEWLVTEQLARRLVATVDNLPRNTRIEPLRPLRPPATPFVVEREVLDATTGTERITLAPANYARYDAVVALLAGADAAAVAAAYRRIYPQLQAAYEDIGYPGRYFNDRVVAVIDHLLATPEPDGPLLLERPKVMYTYADAALEARSPGQKLLLRIGPAHARTVKQKLREIRAQIAAQGPADNDNKE
jgi:hypothetical protein